MRRLILIVSTGLVVGCHARSTPDHPRRVFGLEGQAPSFWTLIPRDSQLSTVATGFGFTEGPLWDTAGFLYVSDETINKIYRVRLDGTKESLIDLGDPDGNTFDTHGRLIDCASVLRALIAIAPDGHYTVLADRYAGQRFNSPNDVVVGPDGALYFTDPTLDLPKGQPQETPFQGIYRLDSTGRVQLLAKDMVQPNGLAFSPDGSRLYVDDTQRQDIRVYDFANGSLSNGRPFGDEPGPRSDGLPDGMKVDQNGNLFVTGPRGVWVWDPAGHHLGTIVLPEQPANLAWGDADYGTLYLTAQTSVYRLRTNAHGFVPYRARR